MMIKIDDMEAIQERGLKKKTQKKGCERAMRALMEGERILNVVELYEL